VDDTRTVAAVAPADLENFWTDGAQAWPPQSETLTQSQPDAHAPSQRLYLKSPHHTCCQGVDQPGVGHVHAAGCPAMARRARLPEKLAELIDDPARFDQLDRKLRTESFPPAYWHGYLDGLMGGWRPAPRHAEREVLLAQLVHASAELAKANLRETHVLGYRFFNLAYCPSVKLKTTPLLPKEIPRSIMRRLSRSASPPPRCTNSIPRSECGTRFMLPSDVSCSGSSPQAAYPR